MIQFTVNEDKKMNTCTVCKKNEATVKTFIGAICTHCDTKTTKMAEEKLLTWKLPRFEQVIL